MNNYSTEVFIEDQMRQGKSGTLKELVDKEMIVEEEISNCCQSEMLDSGQCLNCGAKGND